MLQKIKDIASKLVPLFQKLYALSPFFLGMAAGFFGHGVIKMSADIALATIKTILKV